MIVCHKIRAREKTREERREGLPRNTRKDTRAKRRRIAREIREKTRKEEGKGILDKLGSLATVERLCWQSRKSCKSQPSKEFPPRMVCSDYRKMATSF
jgi:hypothetical protein